MMRLRCPVWCLQCQTTAHHMLLRFLTRTMAPLSYYPRFIQKDGCSCVSGPYLATTQPSRTLASLGGVNWMYRFSVSCLSSQNRPSSPMFQQTNFPWSCHPFAAQFSQDSDSQNSSKRVGQDKEWAILSEYGKTYSATKRYTERRQAGQESDDEELQQEPFDDLSPEDVFGTLTNKYEKKFHAQGDPFDLEVDSDEDEQIRTPPGRQNTPIWYGNHMKKLVKEGKLMEAIDVLEVRMLKEDRVQPIEFNYDVLIGACGRAGYTKKAFRLYNQMKKRGLTPSDVTFTGLFNACAESPWPLSDGLTRLRHLHSQLQEKGITVNQITHHAMIKAYAKCGDLPMAFDLFRDLLSPGIELTSHSFAFLLFACASDKERGLIYGIEAWRQMLQRGIKPDIYTYNLLLRIVRDCGIGDPEVATRVLLKQHTEEQTEMLPAPRKKGMKATGQRSAQPRALRPQNRTQEEMVQVEPLEVRDEANQDGFASVADQRQGLEAAVDKSLVHHREQLPNLLDLSPDASHIQSLGNVSSPSDRLALLGGASGILDSMKDHGVIPDVKSLTLLTQSIPMTSLDEERLLQVVEEYKVKVDVDFYNAIIRRRSRRADLEGAKAILPLIQQKGLFPNLRTFVNLACECSRAKDGIQLLKDMKVAGLKPTVHVYGALITAAARRQDYRYQIELLKCMENDNVSPNKRILEKLEDTAAFGQNPNKESLSKWEVIQQARLNQFRGFYTKWLDRMGVEETPHPWKKFYRPRGDSAEPQE